MEDHGIEDDLNNLINPKDPPFQTKEKVVNIKQTINSKQGKKVCFVITKNNNNSWIDDLYVQEQLNQIERVYH